MDALAGEVAQRAQELRGQTEKGARSRKKKALTDLLEALGAAGLSKHRFAVPSSERSVHSWFTQVCSPWLSTRALMNMIKVGTGMQKYNTQASWIHPGVALLGWLLLHTLAAM